MVSTRTPITIAAETTAIPVGPELARRALALVDAGTTEMAEDVLHVPLDYYRDPERLAGERALCERTPLALVPSAQLGAPGDFVVREVLGTSVLIVRGADGVVRALLELLPASRGQAGPGLRQRTTLHLPVPRLDL